MNKEILLVDDDEICNFINRKSLEQFGIVHNIHSALNGKQALDLFNDYFQGTETLPDLILLDLDMPIMDGFGFLDAFRSLPLPGIHDVKVIILTSSVDPKDKQKAFNYKIAGYLTKPLKAEAVLALLQDDPET